MSIGRVARAAGLAAATMGVVVLWAAAEPPKDQRRPVRAGLADLSWLVGAWQTERGAPCRETWSPAHGRLMLGMCHLTTGSGQPMFESILLEETDGGEVVMWLRHFGPELKSLHADAMRLPLVSRGQGEAVFQESGEGADISRIHYRLVDDDRLTCTVSHPRREGDRTIAIEMRRAS